MDPGIFRGEHGVAENVNGGFAMSGVVLLVGTEDENLSVLDVQGRSKCQHH